MHAVQTSETLAQAQSHSQAGLNILVGMYGRWYTRRAEDPSKGLGVLPGEIQPQGGADLGQLPQPTAGLALLTMGTNPTPSPAVVTLLGDVKLWQTQPRAGYDVIANAIVNADTAQLQLGKLDGRVPRAVAWQRLALTKAQDIDMAQKFAAQALAELETALTAARTLT